MVITEYDSILHTNSIFLKDTEFDLLSAVKTVFILSLSAHSKSHMLTHTQKHTCASMLSQDKNPTTW